jgi:hypothetical protein
VRQGQRRAARGDGQQEQRGSGEIAKRGNEWR